jgi:hypothetical protein
MNFIEPDQAFLTLVVMGICAVGCLVAIVVEMVINKKEKR